MKLKVLVLFLSLFLINTVVSVVPASGQNIGSLSFIHQLGDKEKASLEDGVTFFVLTMGQTSSSFDANVAALKAKTLLNDSKYDKNAPLRRGLLAGMICRYLKLGDSLFYKIFGTDRYAFRACIAAGLMDVDGSEWDILSGEELIEIMARVGEYGGGGK
ncbi:MAG: hypothetical protein GY754_27610 [bacterium]|nr:hypothetical protein [bacterium]